MKLEVNKIKKDQNLFFTFNFQNYVCTTNENNKRTSSFSQFATGVVEIY